MKKLIAKYKQINEKTDRWLETSVMSLTVVIAATTTTNFVVDPNKKIMVAIATAAVVIMVYDLFVFSGGLKFFVPKKKNEHK